MAIGGERAIIDPVEKAYLLVGGVGSPSRQTITGIGTTINLVASTRDSRGSAITNLGSGQFQLAPGKTYKLTSFINSGPGSGAVDFTFFAWHDQTSGSPGVEIVTGTRGHIVDGSNTVSSTAQNAAIAYITPSVLTVVALATTSIGVNTPEINGNTSTIVIEEA